MISRFFSHLLLTGICLFIVGSAFAMPPHPDLLARIRSGEIEAPYALREREALLARGMDNPSRAPRTLDRLLQHSLDEDVNIIAILVDFSDNGAQVEASYFDNLLFGSGEGTLRHYYHEVSYGNMTLVTASLPGDLDWQRMGRSYSYYVDGQNGFGNYPWNAQRLAEDAVNAVDDEVDFSIYDNDGDGEVDGLFIIHAGPGAEVTGNGNHIWSHMWSMSNPPQVDGVTASVYSMEPEYYRSAGDQTVGVYAHEMGHSVFFLPDFYDYDNDSEGLGKWSLMAGGSWNGGRGGASPAHPDALCRVWMGFVNPTNVQNVLYQWWIAPVENDPVIYRLWTDGQQSDEYFLVENRQRIGYDSALPHYGVLIYHIDESEWGNDNQWYPGHTNSGHYLSALEQADGEWNLERNSGQGDSGDPFPGTSDNRDFKVNSIPDSRAYNGDDTHVSVRHIRLLENGMAMASLFSNESNYAFFSLPDSFVVAGQPISVPMVLENDLSGLGVWGFQFTLDFDPAQLNAVAPYVQTVALPANWTLNAQLTTAGHLAVTASGATPLSNVGTLLTFSFTAGDLANGTICPLDFSDFEMTGSAVNADPTGSELMIHAAVAHIHPLSVVFEEIPYGTPSFWAFIVRNQGQAPMVLTSVSAPDAPFRTNFTEPVTVEPQTWYPVSISFHPESAGTFVDTLRVETTGADEPFFVELIGVAFDPAAAGDPVSPIPADYYLAQNYPNPFNPSTTLRFGVPRAGEVTVKVFDVLGREAGTAFQGVLSAGHHEVMWECGDCAAGIYLVMMSVEGRTFVQKAALLK